MSAIDELVDPASEDLVTGREPESPDEELKQIRRQLAGNRRHGIRIQGYGGRLAARYRILTWDEKVEINQRMIAAAEAGDTDARLNSFIDELCTACVGVYRRNPDGKFEKIENGWFLELADRYDFEASTAREVVLGTFNNVEAISAHHDVYREWVRGNGDGPSALEDIDDEFLGE